MVENALEHLLGASRPVISATEVKGMLETWQDLEREWRERPPLEVRLEDYDELLDSGEEDGGQDEAAEAVDVAEAVEAYHFEEVPA